MRAAIFAAMLAMASGVPAGAATFVYVSNAEDGDIGDVHAAAGRLAAAGRARQGREARDADGGEPGQALPDRRGALEAIPGLHLRASTRRPAR